MIKKIIINILIIGFILALYVTKFNDFIRINKVLPDIFLILTLLNGIFIGPMFAMIFGFSAGLSFDFVSGYNIIGYYALIYTLIGYLTSVSKVVYIDNALTSSVSIIVTILIKAFIFLSIGFLFLSFDSITFYFQRVFLIETIYTLALSIPIFLIYKKIFYKSRKSRRNV